MNRSILFVDDERQILKALNRLFADTNHKILLAESGEKALEILAREHVDLIVTDIRMPNMDGYQLLKEVKSTYPHIVRIILSGYTDANKALEFINQNLAKVCLYKPWENQNVLNIIDQILEVDEVLKGKGLLGIVRQIEDLPTLSTIYRQLNEMFDKQEDEEKIIRKIEEDQAITAKILRIVNSGLYGYNVSSIKKAVLWLGLENVKNIIVTNSVFDCLEKKDSARIFLWEHVNLTNKIVTILSKNIFKRRPSECFVVGLLHDIGKVIFLKKFPKQCDKLYYPNNFHEEISIIDAENKIFGISHQEIGGYLLNWWGLPHHIVEAALFHHDPLNANVINKEIVSVVHISNYYSNKMLGNNLFERFLEERTFDIINLPKKSCEELIYKNINCEEGLRICK